MPSMDTHCGKLQAPGFSAAAETVCWMDSEAFQTLMIQVADAEENSAGWDEGKEDQSLGHPADPWH